MNLSRPGTELVYSVTGSGPPVVLGHSLFCQRDMWDGVAAELETDYTLINVGLRGHGESTATEPFTIWDLADDWLAILDAERIERAALCGLSTGGMTAMRFAVTYPERVTGLALIDTDAGPEPSAFKRFQYSTLGLLYRKTGIIPTKTLTRALFGPQTLRERRDVLGALIDKMKSYDREQLGHAMKAIFGRDRVDISEINKPTIVIVGKHDEATPPTRSQFIAGSIAGSTLEVIESAGHLSAIEEPQIVAGLLQSFLPTCFAATAA